MSLLSEKEMTIRAISVAARDLAFVRNALEASEGLGFLVGSSGGDVLLVSSVSQAEMLDRFIDDMAQEVPLTRSTTQAHQGAFDVAE